MAETDERKRRFRLIIVAYPVVLILIGLLANLVLFGVGPAVPAIPSIDVISALAIAAMLLILNHIWLMTSTELTRLKYDMQATPEEWAASESDPKTVSAEGWRELERRHNAHRNTTENTVLFVFVAVVFSLVSPALLAAQIWIIGFGIARLGYTYCYLSGRPDARGLFMSLSLIAIFGMASYLAISLVA